MKTTMLTLLAAIICLQSYSRPADAYRFELLVQQSVDETSVSLVPAYTENQVLVKITHFVAPLKFELYNLGEKIVQCAEISSEEELTTLNLENFEEGYYTLRVHSEDGTVNFVFRIFKENLL